MKITTLALLLSMVAFPSLAQTQESVKADEQIAVKQLETNQRAVYALHLGLTDEESQVFWPIYDAYEAEIKKVTDQRLELLDRYADRYRTLSDADAEDMLEKLWQSEHEALRVRERYARKVRKILPGVKALRYVQLQAGIDNSQLSRVMSLVPLAP